MSGILSAITAFTNWVWGIPMLVFLVGGGVFLTVRLGFLQFRKLPFILKNTIGKSFGKKGEDGRFSGWQAVTGALASTLGAGNIVGTAMAIAFGGPGGVFWMWVTGLVACAIKYSEVTMAMRHRHLNKHGKWDGGPQYYLTEATGWKWISPVYAIVVIIGLFLAASAQVGAGVDNIVSLGAPRFPAIVVFTVLCGVVVVGGMKSLLTVTEKMVPAMSVLYITGALIVIILNIQNLPSAFFSIFRYAFTGHAAVGGFIGAGTAACIRWGVARGIYSNDSGTGITTISHSVAEANHPSQQGMWGVFEVFFSSMIVCTMSCLVILCTGVWTAEGADSSTMTAAAFESALGSIGGVLVTIAIFLFVFTTACAQIEFACAQLGRLIGDLGRQYGRWVMLVMIFIGGLVGIEALIGYVDFVNFFIIFFNMIVIYSHSGEIVESTKEYFSNPQRWETEKWSKWVAMEAEYEKNRHSS